MLLHHVCSHPCEFIALSKACITVNSSVGQKNEELMKWMAISACHLNLFCGVRGCVKENVLGGWQPAAGSVGSWKITAASYRANLAE